MIDPQLMCIQHILGEHRELHALKGSIERTNPKRENHVRHRKMLIKLARSNLIELKSLKERHEELVIHIENHRSPIDQTPVLRYLPKKTIQAKVDKEKSIQDLISRPNACRPKGRCRENIEKALKTLE